ncbi:hypothetical protein D3C72_1800110 [compost metagenome]
MPGFASDRQRVDRVGNHPVAQTQVIFGNAISGKIPGGADVIGQGATVTDSLFKGIDAQMHCR